MKIKHSPYQPGFMNISPGQTATSFLTPKQCIISEHQNPLDYIQEDFVLKLFPFHPDTTTTYNHTSYEPKPARVKSFQETSVATFFNLSRTILRVMNQYLLLGVIIIHF